MCLSDRVECICIIVGYHIKKKQKKNKTPVWVSLATPSLSFTASMADGL